MPKTGPYLKELYKHSEMMSGDPVTDENVIGKNQGWRSGDAVVPHHFDPIPISPI